jgi:hypothetical protein
VVEKRQQVAEQKRKQSKSPQPRNIQKSTPQRNSVRRESTSEESPAGEPATENESTPLTYKDVEGCPISLRISFFDSSKATAPKFSSLFHIGGSNEFATNLNYGRHER